VSRGIPVLTVDGPSGAGKGTVSRAVAQRLGWHFLDSGAIYRALALAVQKARLAPDDVDAVTATAARLNLAFAASDPPVVWLDGEDVTDRLYTESCGSIASTIAALGPVRQQLLQKQRDFRQAPGLVADGRDMGTVVFPDAQYKVYLTASAAVRAGRRFKQLNEKGFDVNLDGLTREIEERDRRDQARAEAPLRMAEGALLIDSSDLGVAEVVERCLGLVRSVATVR
jgi:CMP/dCMP kinase